MGQSSGHENKDKWVGLESFSEMTGPDLIMSMRAGGRRVQGGDNSNFVLSLRMGCNCGTSSAGEVTTQP